MKPKKEKVSARSKMLESAAALLSARGFEGSSFSEVIEHSGAPRGSIYHHFPGGKEELISETITLVGDRVLAFLKNYSGSQQAQTAEGFIKAFIAIWIGVLVRSECKAGCAIASVALECTSSENLSTQAAKIFDSWRAESSRTLQHLGMAERNADAYSLLLIASLEGGLLWSRAARATSKLDDVEESLLNALTAFEKA